MPQRRFAVSVPLAVVCLSWVLAWLVAWLLAAGSPGSAIAAPALGDGEPSEREAVVLLHGLGRTNRSMRPLERRLSDAGFRVENLGYPSLDEDPETLVARLRARVSACCADAPRVHFVTHSLGGILVRAILAEPAPEEARPHALAGVVVGRVVMLAPPNQGSEIVDRLRELEAFEWMLGPTAARLGTDDDSLPRQLPPPTYEVGVIAGNVGINPLGALLPTGASDGTVLVDSTRLPGMTDFLVVPHSHTFIMQSELVAEQVVEFLRRGRFRHEEAP